MKSIVIVFIVFLFCYIGYLLKLKYKNQKTYLEKVRDFLNYYQSNMVVFKNNIFEIINSYKMEQKNKNAKQVNIFKNINKLYKLDENVMEKWIYDSNVAMCIVNYFNNIGNQNFDFEKEKLNDFLKYINTMINISNTELKNKGDLIFKLLIALGLIVAILIW